MNEPLSKPPLKEAMRKAEAADIENQMAIELQAELAPEKIEGLVDANLANQSKSPAALAEQTREYMVKAVERNTLERERCVKRKEEKLKVVSDVVAEKIEGIDDQIKILQQEKTDYRETAKETCASVKAEEDANLTGYDEQIRCAKAWLDAQKAKK